VKLLNYEYCLAGEGEVCRTISGEESILAGDYLGGDFYGEYFIPSLGSEFFVVSVAVSRC